MTKVCQKCRRAVGVGLDDLLGRNTQEHEMSEWQPIETAPHDGTEVLLRSLKGKHADGFWEPKAYCGTGCWVWPYVYCEPAYWMPIPIPPNT